MRRVATIVGGKAGECVTQAFDAICTLLYEGQSPYAEYKRDVLGDREPAFDPFGFDRGTECTFFSEAINAHDPAQPMTIVEVGALLGVSDRLMAGLCRERNLNAVIIACDTWRGDFILNFMPEHRHNLMVVHHGTCTMYEHWLDNTIHEGFDDMIFPLPMDSVNTAQTLIHAGVMADLIYIDGSHTEGLVRMDLQIIGRYCARAA